MLQQEYAPPAPDTSSLPAGNYNALATQDRLQKAAYHAQVDAEAQQADNNRHSLFGRAVQSIVHSLNGTQTSYQANPQTGQVEETTVPAKSPGQFFKNLLMGAIIGGASASAGTVDKDGKITGGGGFLGGLSRGGAGVMQARQQQNDSSFKRAQEQLKAQMEAQKQSEEERYHAALTAHENIQTAEILHNQHMADEKSVRDHNAAVRAYESTLIAGGAQPVKLSINGTLSDVVDGSTFQSAYTKDPSIAKAAPGYQRHFLSTTDLSELHYEDGQWRDDSGKGVDLGKNISIWAYDSPTETMTKPIQTSGKVINAARRQKIVDDNKTYPISPEGMSGIYTLGAKEANEAARTAATNARADKANKLNQQTSQIEAKRAAAKAKANLTYWSRINSNPLAADDEKTGEKGTASRERDEALKAADDAYNTEMGVLRGTAAQPNVLPRKGETQVTQGYTYIFDGKRWVKGKPVVNQ